MWNRRELKEKAKAALKINYWKAVLVSLIFVWVAGGAPSSTATFELSSVFGNTFKEESYDIMEEFEDYEAFELSRRMMDGNKWKTFVLDWSFFLWDMLSVATFGLVEIFYVAPYRNLTNAALYEALSQVYARPNYGSYTQVEYYTNPGNIPPQPSHVEVNPYVNPTQFEEL